MSNEIRRRHLTGKQSRFCEKVLEGLNLSDAYRAAFNAENMKPATVNRAAKELADHPKVAARIKVLREGATAAALKKAAHTLEDAMKEAGDLLEDAQVLGQISAGVAAAKLRAQLAGHLSEKRDARPSSLDDMDVERLLELRAALEAKIKRNKEVSAPVDTHASTPSTPAVPIRRVIG
jgi:phage terminase small subunit